MTQRQRGVLLAVTLTAVFVSIPAAHAGGEISNVSTGIVVCQVLAPDQTTLYVSDVFAVSVDADKLRTTFDRSLVEKYHVQVTASCGGATLGQMTVAQARAYQQKQRAWHRANGKKVIETGWVYTEAAAHFPYLCCAHASRGPKNVFARTSDTIDIPSTAAEEPTGAWRAHLKETHPELVIADSGCTPQTVEDAAARKKRLQYIDNHSVSSTFEIVHVPWTFTPSGKATAPPVDNGR